MTSSGSVAQDSDWSVIVAKHLSLSNSPTLVINNRYAARACRCRRASAP
ncbi:MAG: hypothetical protein WDN06_04955 [Asticcacaulis sp.]